MELAVRFELDLDVPDHARYHKLARRWFDEGSGRLAAELRSEVERTPLPPESVLEGGRWGVPGAAVGFANLMRSGRSTWRRFSAAKFEWFLGRLARDDPPAQDASLGFVRLDAGGYSPTGRPLTLTLTVRRADAGYLDPRRAAWPGWFQLFFEVPEQRLKEPAFEAECLAFLRGVAEDVNPAFGLIDYAYGEGPGTALELSTGPPWRGAHLRVPETRTALRGYGWVTVVAQELADTLGAVRGLSESGAFAEVHPLAHGGVWLQATDRHRNFDEAALRRVALAVAPALPPGRPGRKAGHGPPFRIVYDADH